LDSIAAVAEFSLTTSGAAQSASHLQVVASGVIPPQQQPPLKDHVSDSFSQVSVVPLQIMKTETPTIIALLNTHQVVSLKLTNADETLSP
jgi:ATP adenylyltransferase/5',5'''-P-1,P-4-tetraphosphate phosphorylase II